MNLLNCLKSEEFNYWGYIPRQIIFFDLCFARQTYASKIFARQIYGSIFKFTNGQKCIKLELMAGLWLHFAAKLWFLRQVLSGFSAIYACFHGYSSNRKVYQLRSYARIEAISACVSTILIARFRSRKIPA